jgi:ADP-dependent phosphofructokinase/glucokinase
MVLAADAKDKTIAFHPQSESLTKTRVPLSFVFDTTIFKTVSARELIKCIDSVGMEEVDVDWIFSTIPDAMRAARVTCTELCDATFEEAKECYMTICKTGQMISDDEFERAFNYEPPAKHDANRGISL